MISASTFILNPDFRWHHSVRACALLICLTLTTSRKLHKTRDTSYDPAKMKVLFSFLSWCYSGALFDRLFLSLRDSTLDNAFFWTQSWLPAAVARSSIHRSTLYLSTFIIRIAYNAPAATPARKIHLDMHTFTSRRDAANFAPFMFFVYVQACHTPTGNCALHWSATLTLLNAMSCQYLKILLTQCLTLFLRASSFSCPGRGSWIYHLSTWTFPRSHEYNILLFHTDCAIWIARLPLIRRVRYRPWNVRMITNPRLNTIHVHLLRLFERSIHISVTIDALLW